MTHPKPRQRRRAANHRRILDTALLMVAKGGLEGLTINGLARAVDYTPGALYRYFDSRDALVAALQREVLEAWSERLATALERCGSIAAIGDAAALARPLAVGALYRELSLTDPARYALLSFLSADPRPVLPDPVAATVAGPLIAVFQQVAETLDTPALSPGDSSGRAIALLGSLQGVLQLRKVERLAPGMLAVDSLAEDVVEALLLGWGADPAALSAASKALREVR